MYATNAGDSRISIKMVELAAELTTIEDDILPDIYEELALLTSPDYIPDENPDHEFREQDIEYLEAEKISNERRARVIRQEMERLSTIATSADTPVD